MKGIYKITNIKNNKVYIGESNNIEKRWEQHLLDLRENNHHNYKLQNDWNAFGEDFFKFEVLEELDNKDLSSYKINLMLIYKESVYISRYDSIKNGYNIENTAEKVLRKEKTILSPTNDAKYLKYLIDTEGGTLVTNKSEDISDVLSADCCDCVYLPNKAIQTNIDNNFNKDISYCNEFGSKILLILSYLFINKGTRHICNCTLEDIISFCGFSCNKSTTKTFLKILKELSNKINSSNKLPIIEFITKDNITLKNLIKIKINIFNIDDNNKYCKYFKLTDIEREKILNCSKEGIDKYILLATFCSIKSRMQKREVSGYTGNISYPTFIRIAEDVGCSESIISKYIEVLQELNLIIVKNVGAFKHLNTGNIKEAGNTYYLYDSENLYLNSFIEESSNLYVFQKESKGYKLIDNFDRNKFKKLGGEKGRIKRNINEGKATNKDIERLKEIDDILNRNRIK